MYMVKGKHPRMKGFQAGDKHFKISFSQNSYEHEQNDFQRCHLKPASKMEVFAKIVDSWKALAIFAKISTLVLYIYWRLTF